jgi:predicted acylesterase/phospholipase RssA
MTPAENPLSMESICCQEDISGHAPAPPGDGVGGPDTGFQDGPPVSPESSDVVYPQRKIKHLVLSGGTVWGFSMIGILQKAIQVGFLNMDDVQSIFMTSVGSIVGLAYSLKIEPDLIANYFIKRPWDTVSKNSRYSVLEIFDKKGIIHRGFFENIFEPLFKSVDLSCDITLLELHEYNGMDIHIYATELNGFELVDISYKTHPDWTVIDAIYASCSIPVIFCPLLKDDNCYIDGGFFLNYPITKCVCENTDEVLGISLGNFPKNYRQTSISGSSNILNIIISVIYNVIHNNGLFTNDNSRDFPYQFILKNITSLEYILKCLYEKEEREHLVKMGIDFFINKMKESMKGSTKESMKGSTKESTKGSIEDPLD